MKICDKYSSFQGYENVAGIHVKQNMWKNVNSSQIPFIIKKNDNISKKMVDSKR